MAKKNVCVEPRANDTFAIIKPNAQRVSAICDTQRDAIKKTKAMFQILSRISRACVTHPAARRIIFA